MEELETIAHALMVCFLCYFQRDGLTANSSQDHAGISTPMGIVVIQLEPTNIPLAHRWDYVAKAP